MVTFLPGTAVEMTRRYSLPVFGNPERAVGVMAGLIEYGRFARKARQGLFGTLSSNKSKRTLPFIHSEPLDEHHGKQILTDHQIPVTREGVAKTKAEALSMAGEIGYPVALKILSSEILHKTDRGGVILSIRDNNELEQSIDLLSKRFPTVNNPNHKDCFLVQEMIDKGIEVLLGMVNDPHFGPLLVLGLGGILVEVLKDVVFAKPPITAFQAEQLWRSLRGSAMMDGVRGKPPGDMDALVQATVNFSLLIAEIGQYFEGIDINPLVVLPKGQGVKALDALFVGKTKDEGEILRATRKVSP